MYDLIYAERKDWYDETISLIKNKFPDAEIKDGSDDFHTYRYSVEIDDQKRDDFYAFIISEGMIDLSLYLQTIAISKDEENGKELIRLIEHAKETYPEKLKKVSA